MQNVSFWQLQIWNYLLLAANLHAFLRTLICNPGVSKGLFDPNKDKDDDSALDVDKCLHCYIPRTEYTTHCAVCGVCVDEIDHHCIFFGKCIAKNNLDSFNTTICLFVSTLFYFMLLVTLEGLW